MASKKPLTSRESQALSIVKPWLEINGIAPSKEITTIPSVAKAAVAGLYSRTIPEHWSEFQKSAMNSMHDERNKLRTANKVLGCVALSRNAFMLDRIAKGMTKDQAEDISWRGMDKYLHAVEHRQIGLPAEILLKLPIAEAVIAYTRKDDAYRNPVHTYSALIGLGIVALSQQAETYKPGASIIVPQPGTSESIPPRWNMSTIT